MLTTFGFSSASSRALARKGTLSWAAQQQVWYPPTGLTKRLHRRIRCHAKVIGEQFNEVLEAGKRGEPWAFEAIYRDLAPSVLGYLRGQGGRNPEDLTSEVFVAIVAGLKGFQGEERAFRSWVFTIVHRRLVDERRHLATRREYLVPPHTLRSLGRQDGVGDVEEEAVSVLEFGRIFRMLDILTPEQRTVLLLRVVADLSLTEVAAMLGKKEAAVKMLQRRALLKLTREISPESVT
jgi:RNA polymerase sigma factor (sigma-70 family)